jgi:hypothetical protein
MLCHSFESLYIETSGMQNTDNPLQQETRALSYYNMRITRIASLGRADPARSKTGSILGWRSCLYRRRIQLSGTGLRPGLV